MTHIGRVRDVEYLQLCLRVNPEPPFRMRLADVAVVHLQLSNLFCVLNSGTLTITSCM
jgi:hypothetical protein